jgi:nucleoside recognition membrane protein YjiH
MAEPTALASACAVNFWTFAVPVIAGMTGSHVVGLAAKRVFKSDHASTQDAAMMATKFGAFWLISGFTWIALCRRNGAQKA